MEKCYRHNDGKVFKSFDDAMNYLEENYFDDNFEEISDEEYYEFSDKEDLLE